MAETYWTGTSGPAPGSRLVRVRINGVVQAPSTGIDPFTAAGLPGARFTPALFPYTVTGSAGGSVQVSLDALLDQPSVVAIEVYRLSGEPVASPAPVVPSPAPVVTSPAPVVPSPAPVVPSPAPVVPSPAPVAPSPNPANASGCPNQPAGSTLVARLNAGAQPGSAQRAALA